MAIVIADCNFGNKHSAQKAFRLMALETGAGTVEVTSDPERIAEADRLVLPGVGAFADCKTEIFKQYGMADAITECAKEKGAPFLGICVGMQLLASLGREHGTTEGFDWISGEVVEITPNDPSLKVPHMGWNDLAIECEHPLFSDVKTGPAATPGTPKSDDMRKRKAAFSKNMKRPNFPRQLRFFFVVSESQL